jgi:hypothetical protein
MNNNQPKQPKKNELIELSENQSNPGLADPLDFAVENELSSFGQEGNTLRENTGISSQDQKPRRSLNKRNRPGVTVSE